jgi:hypothetical protein
LSGKLCSWLHGFMQPDGCHLFRFRVCFYSLFIESYDITDLNFC